MKKKSKSKVGRPRTRPEGSRLWAKWLTPAEIAAVEKLVEQMRRPASQSTVPADRKP